MIFQTLRMTGEWWFRRYAVSHVVVCCGVSERFCFYSVSTTFGLFTHMLFGPRSHQMSHCGGLHVVSWFFFSHDRASAVV